MLVLDTSYYTFNVLHCTFMLHTPHDGLFTPSPLHAPQKRRTACTTAKIPKNLKYSLKSYMSVYAEKYGFLLHTCFKKISNSYHNTILQTAIKNA